jgi:hypothetical protein
MNVKTEDFSYINGYQNTSDKNLKNAVWLYFVLLIFEGALRKWVLPGLATPLLIVRDPVAIWLLIVSWRRGLLTTNIYLTSMLLIGVLGIFTAVLLGHGSFVVALFGARIILVQFPVIFVIGSVFDRQDVIKVGTFLIWLSIPMTVLLILQFYSPQSAWVNRGVGGDTEGGGFSGALGYLRAPTTFSFTNGTTLFYSLLACFVFFFWLSPKKYISNILLISASIALLLSIPFSISRSLLFSVFITLAFVIIAVSKNRNSLGRIIVVVVVLLMSLVALSQISIFQTATEAFTSRFASASDSEGGLKGTLGDRYLGGLISSIEYANDIPFFGYGLGSATNVGNSLLTGKIVAATGEQEWSRLISELGIIMGVLVIFIRLIVSFKISIASYKQLSTGDFLPWILLSFCLLMLPQGQWSQSTSLGFCVIGAGFTIASMRLPESNMH